jgi:hypothetical protein
MGRVYSIAGIVPRLRMSGAIPLLPLYAFMAGQGQHSRKKAATVAVRSMY